MKKTGYFATVLILIATLGACSSQKKPIHETTPLLVIGQPPARTTNRRKTIIGYIEFAVFLIRCAAYGMAIGTLLVLIVMAHR